MREYPELDDDTIDEDDIMFWWFDYDAVRTEVFAGKKDAVRIARPGGVHTCTA